MTIIQRIRLNRTLAIILLIAVLIVVTIAAKVKARQWHQRIVVHNSIHNSDSNLTSVISDNDISTPDLPTLTSVEPTPGASPHPSNTPAVDNSHPQEKGGNVSVNVNSSNDANANSHNVTRVETNNFTSTTEDGVTHVTGNDNNATVTHPGPNDTVISGDGFSTKIHSESSGGSSKNSSNVQIHSNVTSNSTTNIHSSTHIHTESSSH